MSFYQRYELLDLCRDDGVKTFEARQISTGRPVKVHLFVRPSAPLQAALLEAIDRLPESEQQRLIERGTHEGTPYAVTDRLIDHPGLSEWVLGATRHGKPSASPAKPRLEAAGAWKVPSASGSPAVPTPNPATTSSHGLKTGSSNATSSLDQQFTDLFATAELPIVRPSLHLNAESTQNVAELLPLSLPLAAPPLLPGEPESDPHTIAEAGEFTRSFQSPPAMPPPITPEAPRDTSISSSPPRPEASPPEGEFTRMFQSPVAVPRSPQAPNAHPPQAGEFTRMFQSPASPEATPPMPAASHSPLTASKAGPGDFTRFFETSSPAGAMPHSPALQQPSCPQAPGRFGDNQVSEFTRIFGKGEGPDLVPPPLPPARSHPGEFTRMFQSPGAPIEPATKPGPPLSDFTHTSGTPQFQPPFRSPDRGGEAGSGGGQMGGATKGATQAFATPPISAAPNQSGPGEYTRQFSAPAPLTFGQHSGSASSAPPAASSLAFAPPATAQPAMPNMDSRPAEAKKSFLLILGIVGIIVVATLLVVFFAFVRSK